MSIALYDTAIIDKIKKWVAKPGLTILNPEESRRFFTQLIDEQNDKPIQLPAIALSRGRDIGIRIPAKRPLTHRGKVFNATDKAADHLDAIPITLNYQIDIYTRYDAEALEYFRALIFQIVNYPTITIELPYRDCNIKQDAFMTLVTPASDNSDIPERLVPGQFTRMTIRFTLEDAYIYAYQTDYITKISPIGIYLDENFNNSVHHIGDSCQLDTNIDITKK